MSGPGDDDDDEPLPSGDVAHSSTVVGDPVADTIPAHSLSHTESATIYDRSVASHAMRQAYRVVPRPGEAIGERNRFVVTGTLGTGGMGFVCRAHDQELDRNVAIKFIQRDHELPWPQLTTLLRQEAKATAKLNHENIVSIFDIGTWGRVPFLVIEHLDGETLSRMLRRSPPTVERATEIMIDVLAGLDHAHRANVIHRDLKPSNVFIVQGGRAKILDFGLAHIDRAVHVTSAGGLVDDASARLPSGGTPPYMAPEQWRRTAQDARTDIWSAGVMLYELLTGELPHGKTDAPSLRAWSASRQPAPSILSRRSALPESLDRIVARALRKDPRQRFQTAAEFLAALRESLTGIRGGAPLRGDRKRAPERRQATLLSVAPVIAALTSDEPDDAVDELGLFQEVVTEAVNAQGGRIFSAGDSVLAGFGYPIADEHDAVRAVRAGLRIVERLREWGHGVRVGIHTGVVVVEELGGNQGTAVRGDAPRTAAALAGQAEPGAVLLGETTQQLVRHLVSTEPVAADAAHAPAHRVLAEEAPGSRFEPRFAAKPTPFVGRGRRIRFLTELWDAAKDGRGTVAHISGEAGIGKSRLVQELRQRVEKEGNTRLTCQAWPHFRDSAFRPIVELLLRSLYIRREDPPAVKLSKLENALAALGFQLAADIPVFAPLLSIPLAEPYQPLGIPPSAQKSQTLAALVQLMLAMAHQKPVLLVVEDMHWVDHSTLEMVHKLMAKAPSARLLMLLTSRPEFRPPWSDRDDVHNVSIERLSRSQTAAMIEAVAGRHALPPELTAQLITRTDGIPLFVEEMTSMITDAIDADGTVPQAAAIPATLSEILLARLDRLPSTSMEVARIGSVIGRSFSYSMIRRAADVAEDTLSQGLAQLVDAGVLVSSGRAAAPGSPAARYRFKHALIQDSAYQSLLKKQRQERHSRVAEILEADLPDTEPELLAHHHTEAGHFDVAFELWTKAGQRAVERSANVEAVGHFQNALQALRTFPDSVARNRRELNVLLLLGSPLMAIKGYGNPEVEKTYARAYELCGSAKVSDPDMFSALQGLWQYGMVSGDMRKAIMFSEQLLSLAYGDDNDLFKLLAHRCYGATSLVIGDLPAAREHLSTAFRFYDFETHKGLSLRFGHDPGVAYGLYHAWSLWLLGHPDQALARVRQALDLATRLAHPMTIAFASCYTALIYCHRGEFEIARDMADHAIRLCVEHKLALWLAFANMMAGWARSALGEYAAGVEQFKDGLAGWKRSGAGAGLTFFAMTCAECCRRAGWNDQAAELLTESVAMLDKNNEHYYEAELYRCQGELAEAAGDLATAERLFRAGMALAAQQQAKPLELRSAISLARLLARRGEDAAGRRLVAAIYEGFTEGLDTLDLVSARQLLDGN